MVRLGEMTRRILAKAQKEMRASLLEPEANAVCANYDIPVPPFEVVENEEEAVLAAARLGFPAVMKIVSPDILHKTEAGGVLLNLGDQRSVANGFSRIVANALEHKPGARIVGVLVQKMSAPGIEVIVGGIMDPQFDQVVMFGLGGVFVEVLQDVTFRVAPIKIDDAREMVHEIKSYRLLKGYRAQPRADEESIARILVSTSRIMMENSEIEEMDLNPVIVYPQGASAVDARIILSGEAPVGVHPVHQ